MLIAFHHSRKSSAVKNNLKFHHLLTIVSVLIVLALGIEGTKTKPKPKSSHYSGRRIESITDKKVNNKNQNQASFNGFNSWNDGHDGGGRSTYFSSFSSGNRRLDLDLESQSHSQYKYNQLDFDYPKNSQYHLNSWDTNEKAHHNHNNVEYSTQDGENKDSLYNFNSLYYEEPSSSSSSPSSGVEESWPYLPISYKEAAQAPTSALGSNYEYKAPSTSSPFYPAFYPTESPVTVTGDTASEENDKESLAQAENEVDTLDFGGKIRKTIKDMAANIGLCAGSWTGCVICVVTFGQLPLGPLPASCITSCSLGILTNCARFDLFSHIK